MIARRLGLGDHVSLRDFLGAKVIAMLYLGVGVGIMLFFVELGMAFALQGFLAILGVIEPARMHLPPWATGWSTFAVFGLLISMGALRALLQWAQVYLQGGAYEFFKHHQRARVLGWVYGSESVSSGQVMTLFNDLSGAAGSSVMGVQSIMMNFTLALMLSVQLFRSAPEVTAIAVIALLALGLPLRVFDYKLKRVGQGITREVDRMNRQLAISIKNLLLMQIYGTRRSEEEKCQKSLSLTVDHYMTAQSITGLKYSLAPLVGIVVVCLIGFLNRNAVAAPKGDLLIYFYLFIRFVQHFAEVVRGSSVLAAHLPSVQELAAWWNQHEVAEACQVKDAAVDFQKAVLSQPVGWNLRGVDFGYRQGPLILRNFSLVIEPGQAVVVTGPSGAGKSTLLGLLLGLLKPTKGEIEVVIDSGKCSIETVRSGLYSHIGYVGPESFLVEGTVRENLLYGFRGTVTDTDIQRVLHAAECRFVEELPGKLEYPITEQGQGLSAGQKQRLSLARALLRDPRALFLDEATSNLDEVTEASLIRTFETLKGRVTIIAVTHRSSMLRIADRQVQL